MPFISISRKDLQKALSISNQISSKKSDVEVLTYSKVTVTPSDITISSLSGQVFYSTAIKTDQNDFTQSIDFLIKTDLFASSVGIMSDEAIGIDFQFQKQTLVIQGAKSKHTLRIDIDKAREFIVPLQKPEEVEIKAEIPTKELSEALRVSFTTVGLPKNTYQPEFLNVCLTIQPEQNSLTVVSCDKFRISKTLVNVLFSNINEEFKTGHNFLLPPKGLQLVLPAVEELDSVEFQFERSVVWITNGEWKFVLRYGDGTYPDYNKIIPQSFTCSFLLSVKDVKEALKQVYFTARANVMNKSVVMSVDPAHKSLIFSSSSEDGFASESSIELLNYEGIPEPWNQTFNADYLLDYINNLNQEKVLFEVNPGKPLVMSPENEKRRQLCLVQVLR